MASIQKRGKGYRIIVSNGYDINGVKITETATWIPEPGMKKERNRNRSESICSRI